MRLHRHHPLLRLAGVVGTRFRPRRSEPIGSLVTTSANVVRLMAQSSAPKSSPTAVGRRRGPVRRCLHRVAMMDLEQQSIPIPIRELGRATAQAAFAKAGGRSGTARPAGQPAGVHRAQLACESAGTGMNAARRLPVQASRREPVVRMSHAKSQGIGIARVRAPAGPIRSGPASPVWAAAAAGPHAMAAR